MRSQPLEVTWHICINSPGTACHAADRHVGRDAFRGQFRAQYTIHSITKISPHLPAPV